MRSIVASCVPEYGHYSTASRANYTIKLQKRLIGVNTAIACRQQSRNLAHGQINIALAGLAARFTLALDRRQIDRFANPQVKRGALGAQGAPEKSVVVPVIATGTTGAPLSSTIKARPGRPRRRAGTRVRPPSGESKADSRIARRAPPDPKPGGHIGRAGQGCRRTGGLKYSVQTRPAPKYLMHPSLRCFQTKKRAQKAGRRLRRG